jgi:hypothetical protein
MYTLDLQALLIKGNRVSLLYVILLNFPRCEIAGVPIEIHYQNCNRDAHAKNSFAIRASTSQARLCTNIKTTSQTIFTTVIFALAILHAEAKGTIRSATSRRLRDRFTHDSVSVVPLFTVPLRFPRTSRPARAVLVASFGLRYSVTKLLFYAVGHFTEPYCCPSRDRDYSVLGRILGWRTTWRGLAQSLIGG